MTEERLFFSFLTIILIWYIINSPVRSWDVPMRRGVGSDYDDDRDVVEIHVHAVTKKAVLVSVDGDEESSTWLPRSLVATEDGRPFRRGSVTTILAPQWLLEREGLV